MIFPDDSLLTNAKIAAIVTGASADTPLAADEWTFRDVVDGLLKKITWTNFIASVKGAVNYILNDGTVNPTNLLVNGDFEIWSNAVPPVPLGWAYADTVAVENTIVKMGLSSLKLTRSTGTCYCYQSIPVSRGITYWKGRTVTFGCWVYATVASRAKLRINDGVGDTSSAFHSGGSAWEWLSVTRTLNANASQVVFVCDIVTGNTTAYFDGAIAVEGASAFAFEKKPAVQMQIIEAGNADYTITDDVSPLTVIFRNVTANRVCNAPTLSANQGREITVILDCTTETLTTDVDPATSWAADDIITGQTSGATCICVAKLAAHSWQVKMRQGTYTLGEIIGVTGTAAKLADQGAANPTFSGAGSKVTLVHEGTDKINGFAADVDITENGGWWKITGTATEWRGITDGNSTKVYFKNESDVAASATTLNTWQNFAVSHEITIGVGTWDIEYSIAPRSTVTTGTQAIVKATLSTANNSESDKEWSCKGFVRDSHVAATIGIINTFFKKGRMTFAAADTLYLNIYHNSADGAAATLETTGTESTSKITAWRVE